MLAQKLFILALPDCQWETNFSNGTRDLERKGIKLSREVRQAQPCSEARASDRTTHTMVCAIRSSSGAKNFRIRGWAIQMPNQSLLHAVARRSKLLPELFHLLFRQWRKAARSFYVVFEHFQTWHAYNGAGYRQAHGVAK